MCIYTHTHLQRKYILLMNFMCMVTWGGMEQLMAKFRKKIKKLQKIVLCIHIHIHTHTYTYTHVYTYPHKFTLKQSYIHSHIHIF